MLTFPTSYKKERKKEEPVTFLDYGSKNNAKNQNFNHACDVIWLNENEANF